MFETIQGPNAAPLARILEGAFFYYLIPVFFDLLILSKLLQIPKKSRLAIASLFANGLVFVILDYLFHFSFTSVNAPLWVIVSAATIKTVIYWKILTDNKLKDVFLAVLCSTVIGEIIAVALWKVVAANILNFLEPKAIGRL